MNQRTDSIYKCISNSRYTPYLLAKKIGAKAILESASFAKGRERYSILMTEEAFKIRQDDDGIDAQLIEVRLAKDMCDEAYQLRGFVKIHLIRSKEIGRYIIEIRILRSANAERHPTQHNKY